MNYQLLQQYNLNFYKRNGSRHTFLITNGHPELSTFLMRIGEDEDILLDGIALCDLYLSGGSTPDDNIGGHFGSAIVSPSGIYIYDSNSPEIVIPTQDFRDILQMWYDFIKS
ncbi:MAG: hypothetical protein H6578_09120 [Chitinophagales bacterium]|nr:hypothetical protein [Chitinophagales bacterium]